MALGKASLLFALPLLAACEPTGPRSDELRIIVQQHALTAPATIRFTVTNAARSVAEFDLCDGHIAATIEPAVLGVTPTISPACPIPAAPFLLTSGASAVDSVSIGAAGVYRLRVGFSRPPSRVLFQVTSDTITIH